MLRLQMLPAGCGDCLWLEYGPVGDTHVVIIDGGVRETISVLRERIRSACRERGTTSLDVELLVVTHIDNDHILGIIELLITESQLVTVKDIWFNGRPQLSRLPPRAVSESADEDSTIRRRSKMPPDLMGSEDEEEADDEQFDDSLPLLSPADLLGPQQSDQLSELLVAHDVPWNKNRLWNGNAVLVPDCGDLPATTIDGGLKLTLLGPTPARLYKLCTAWPDVLGGTDQPSATKAASPADLLGRGGTWPPVWKEREQRDPSVANGSSIMLLAEYENGALLLSGDGHAPDLASALVRLCRERKIAASRIPITAFKVPHHASEKNITRAVLQKVDCSRYLISTDGTNHKHPDHQALLRILRYSERTPELMFNYLTETTRPWRNSKSDVVGEGFQDYETRFPDNAADGLIVDLN